jgi:hypothetical protein
MGKLDRDYGPAWPWAWGVTAPEEPGDGGMVVEHWWSHGEEGQSRLNTRLLAQVLRDPEFVALHTGQSGSLAWPPQQLRLEPPTERRQLARLAS